MDISKFHAVRYKYKGEKFHLHFDFTIGTFQKEKRRGRRFDFHETLLKFLSQNPKKTIYITQKNLDNGGFEMSDDNIFLNIYEFQRFCFGLDPRIDRADAFFRQDVSLENISFRGATEEQILDWFTHLSINEQQKFLQRIGSTSSTNELSNDELVNEIKKRKIPLKAIQDIILLTTKSTKDIKILEKVSMGIDIRKFELVLDIWNKNKKNKNEEFWQEIFQKHSWILSQVFSAPMIFIKGKPYCGGKNPDNEGGVYSDFRFETLKTGTSVFIEIKTPLSKIINKQYRGKEVGDNNLVYSMGEEVTGGTIQLINQRQTAIAEFEKNNQLKIRNSKGILILGSTEEMIDEQKKSFDIFRNSNRDIEIITFDELFNKIQTLKDLLIN